MKVNGANETKIDMPPETQPLIDNKNAERDNAIKEVAFTSLECLGFGIASACCCCFIFVGIGNGITSSYDYVTPFAITGVVLGCFCTLFYYLVKYNNICCKVN